MVLHEPITWGETQQLNRNMIRIFYLEVSWDGMFIRTKAQQNVVPTTSAFAGAVCSLTSYLTKEKQYPFHHQPRVARGPQLADKNPWQNQKQQKGSKANGSIVLLCIIFLTVVAQDISINELIQGLLQWSIDIGIKVK